MHEVTPHGFRLKAPPHTSISGLSGTPPWSWMVGAEDFESPAPHQGAACLCSCFDIGKLFIAGEAGGLCLERSFFCAVGARVRCAALFFFFW